MSNLILILIVGFIFYMLNRNYKSEDFQHIQTDKKQNFDGNLAEHEAGLLVAMLAKVAKADGRVSELEAELLSHTFTDIANHFENSQVIREELKSIYKKEMQTFDNTIEVAQKYLKLTKYEYKKRLQVMEYLLNLAFIDDDFSQTEFMILEDISNALEIKRSDFEALIKAFETFNAQQRDTKELTLKKAYEILGVKETDDFTTIKKQYRKLVKQNHPDIVAGQGKDQTIIEQATKKLQEINEAYEILKKEKKQ